SLSSRHKVILLHLISNALACHNTNTFFSLITLAPPPPLFPYTTLFRSPTARLTATGGPCARPRSPGRPSAPSGPRCAPRPSAPRSEEHTSELQSLRHLVCRLLLEKKNNMANSALAIEKQKQRTLAAPSS